MKNGLVIADAGPIFSLAIIDQLGLLNHIFNEVCIPKAVWEEITLNKRTTFYNLIKDYFEPKVVDIKSL